MCSTATLVGSRSSSRTNAAIVAAEVRRLFAGDGTSDSADGTDGMGAGVAIGLTLSTRTLVRWARLVVAHRGAPDPVSYALDRALLNRADAETAEAVRSITQRVCGRSSSGTQSDAD